MTLPDPAALPLSPTAQSMLALRDVVFQVWEQRGRERFAAALTHDLRGPLAAAALGLELIAVATDPAVMKTAAIARP